jgi:hypothetical protein
MLKFNLKFILSFLLFLTWTLPTQAYDSLKCEVTSYQQAINSGYTIEWAKSWVPEVFFIDVDDTGLIKVGRYWKDIISNKDKGDKIEFAIKVPNRNDNAVIKGTYFKKTMKFAVRITYPHYRDSGNIRGLCEVRGITLPKNNNVLENSILEAHSNVQICEASTIRDEEMNNIWNINSKKFVDEAKRRGLTCGVSERSSTQVSSSTSNTSTQTNIPEFIYNLNEFQLCDLATYNNKWSERFHLHVQEAKRRGLTCGVNESSSTQVASSSSSSSQSIIPTSTDTQIPLITITRADTDDKQGIVAGQVSDNVGVAELTVDGNIIPLMSDGSFEYSTYVSAAGKTIKIQATDLSGLSSSQAVTLKRNADLTIASVTFDELNPIAKPVKSNNTALALIIGVSDYENTPAKAIFADTDALVFHDYASEKLGIPENQIKTLVNDGADEREMLLAVQSWLSRSVKQDQTDVYVFFAGHGLASDDGQNMYLLPYDGSPELLDRTAILRDELFTDIASANPRSVTVFLDTCYSGSSRGSEMLIAARPILLKAKESAVPEGFTVFTAAAGDETAKPLEEAKHGLFSYFLMKGMEGDADTNGDKQITAGELHAYVKSNVVQQSSGTQTPELQGDADRVLVRFQ